MHKHWIKRIVFALVFMLLAVGCTTSTPQPAPTLVPTAVPPTATIAPTNTPAPTATFTLGPPEPTIDVGDFPIGKYTVKGSKYDGAWTFSAAGKYNFYWHEIRNAEGAEASSTEKGSFTVSGNKITLKTESSTDICGVEIYAYEWEFDGSTLTLKSLDDQCDVRVYVVEKEPWVKEP